MRRTFLSAGSVCLAGLLSAPAQPLMAQVATGSGAVNAATRATTDAAVRSANRAATDAAVGAAFRRLTLPQLRTALDAARIAVCRA